MNFWKHLRLVGTAIVLLLGVIAIVGVLMQPESTATEAREPVGLPSQPANRTTGL